MYEIMVNKGLHEPLIKYKKHFEETKIRIHNFIRRETEGEKALECVIIKTLCSVNQK